MGKRELLKKAHEAARAEFGRSSPLRVGIILGRTWGSFPCPTGRSAAAGRLAAGR